MSCASIEKTSSSSKSSTGQWFSRLIVSDERITEVIKTVLAENPTQCASVGDLTERDVRNIVRDEVEVASEACEDRISGVETVVGAQGSELSALKKKNETNSNAINALGVVFVICVFGLGIGIYFVSAAHKKEDDAYIGSSKHYVSRRGHS